MFNDTIFDNTKVVKQEYSFEYLNILWPLNNQTEMTIAIYDKVIKLVDDTGSLWDSD